MKKSVEAADTSRRQPFSVVLLLGDMQGGESLEGVPAAARKALADTKDFLPYKNYRLARLAVDALLQWHDVGDYADSRPGRSAVPARAAGVADLRHELAGGVRGGRAVGPLLPARAGTAVGNVDEI